MIKSGKLQGCVVIVAALAGCAQDSKPALMIADSAGVEVITNLPGSIESAEDWTLSTEPIVEIGAGPNPPVALFRVTAVVPLHGQRVVLGMNAPPQALVFNHHGTLEAALGRAGEGPGEFGSVASVVSVGADSVAVWDPDRRRMSLFSLDGDYGREVDLSAIAPPGVPPSTSRTDAGYTHLLRSSSEFLYLFAEGIYSSSNNRIVARPRLLTHRITTEGEEVTTFGPFPGMQVDLGSPAGTLPVPLGARTYATTVDDALVVGTAEAPEYRVFEPGGRLVRIVRWPDRDRAVEGRHLAAWSAMLDSQPTMQRFVEPIPLPERFPAYQGVISSEAGEVLVGDYAGPLGIWPLRRAESAPEGFGPTRRLPERRWVVFDRGGVLVASVMMPEGFAPYVIHDGLLWGVFTDELDVESVRAYQLTRS